MINVGFTFLAPNVQYSTQHLHIIIAITDNDRALFVNITTRKANKDDTCVIKTGEHRFIRHDSVINYGDAKDAPIIKIKEAIEMNLFTPHDPVSTELLKRIQIGALNSPAFPQKYLKYIPGNQT